METRPSMLSLLPTLPDKGTEEKEKWKKEEKKRRGEGR